MEITIQDLWKIFLKRWWIILLCALLCAAILTTYIALTKEDTYTASATVYLSGDTQNGDQFTTGTISLAQQLVKAYIIMLESNRILDHVSTMCTKENGCNNPYTTEALRDMITVTQVQESWIFQISVTAQDPADALFVANAVAEEGTTIIRNEIIKAGNASVLDKAQSASVNSVNVVKYVAIGGAIGAFLSYLVAVVFFLMDTTVHSEFDLRNTVDWPVIGVIYSLDEEDPKKKGYKYTRYEYYRHHPHKGGEEK